MTSLWEQDPLITYLKPWARLKDIPEFIPVDIGVDTSDVKPITCTPESINKDALSSLLRCMAENHRLRTQLRISGNKLQVSHEHQAQEITQLKAEVTRLQKANENIHALRQKLTELTQEHKAKTKAEIRNHKDVKTILRNLKRARKETRTLKLTIELNARNQLQSTISTPIH
jgi:predicted RNase H-like nuclease (RuvC/YqgF family)